MELKFDILKPNLYVVEDEVYFGIDNSEVISVSRSVDESIKKYIGVLKVKEADLETIENGKSKKTERKYSVPLTKYLKVIGIASEGGLIEDVGITNNAARLFGLNYIIDAQTMEIGQDMLNWKALQRDLSNPDELFNKFEEEILVYRLDREKTLEEMRRLHGELNPNIPNNYAELVIINGQVPFSEQTIKNQYLGIVNLMKLKAKNKNKIEEVKTDLVERLKEVKGPCLSLDVPSIFHQMRRLYADAPQLVQEYGDVLKSPWKSRLFKLDP